MRIAAKLLLLEHTAEVAAELDAITAEHAFAESLVPVLLGIDTAAQAHDRAERMARATREAQATIDRERRGEAVRPPFRGVLQALRALDDFRLDGPPVRRSSLEQTETLTERGEGAASMVERLADVAACWDACLADGWVYMAPEQARAVVVWGVLGLPGAVTAKQPYTPRSGPGVRQQAPKRKVHLRGAPMDKDMFEKGKAPTDGQVAAHASAEFALSVEAGHVSQVRAEGLREMHARLAARGLVPHSERMATMTSAKRLEDLDLHGMKDIRAAVGAGTYDEKTLRAWSKRAEDPLPLYDVRGQVCASRAELAAWSERELARSRRGR